MECVSKYDITALKWSAKKKSTPDRAIFDASEESEVDGLVSPLLVQSHALHYS